MRRFEYSLKGTQLFWEIWVDGHSVQTCFGRMGTQGEQRRSECKNAEEAQLEADRLILAMLNKGYVEQPAFAIDSPLVAFVNALRENPDDLVGWQAFADYLTEEGDYRAEFMTLQLALEDESLEKKTRAVLSAREAEFLSHHQYRLIGEQLAQALFPAMEAGNSPQDMVFRRGWLWEIHNLNISPIMADECFRAMNAAESLLFLAELHLRDLVNDLSVLAIAPFTKTLRRLRIGEDEYQSRCQCPGIAEFVRACSSLESLFIAAQEVDTEELFFVPMPNLVELSVNCTRDYALEVLAKNKSLHRLESVQFRPYAEDYLEGDAYLNARLLSQLGRSRELPNLKHLAYHFWDGGDAMANALIRTGLLYRLETLNLQYGNLTDAGAERLLEALQEHEHRLTKLVLDDNCLRSEDTLVDAFLEIDIELSADSQRDEDDQSDWDDAIS